MLNLSDEGTKHLTKDTIEFGQNIHENALSAEFGRFDETHPQPGYIDMHTHQRRANQHVRVVLLL